MAEDEVRALDQAVILLKNQACTVGIQRLKNISVRLQFNREITEYTRGIVQDVYNGKKSTEQGLEAINKQRTALVKHTLMDKALLGRLVLKPDSWRLFRHIRTDYLYGFQRYTVGGAAIGKTSDVNTLQTLFDYWRDE